jgi:hypothetical protein
MFDPRAFHAFAVRCSSDEPAEAACRTAISRAYYAAYLVAYIYVQEKGIRAVPQPGQRWGPHERTIHAVAAIRHPGAGFIAEELAKLKYRRIDADYHLEYAHARRHAAKAIRDAARIIAWFDGLP